MAALLDESGLGPTDHLAKVGPRAGPARSRRRDALSRPRPPVEGSKPPGRTSWGGDESTVRDRQAHQSASDGPSWSIRQPRLGKPKRDCANGIHCERINPTRGRGDGRADVLGALRGGDLREGSNSVTRTGRPSAGYPTSCSSNAAASSTTTRRRRRHARRPGTPGVRRARGSTPGSPDRNRHRPSRSATRPARTPGAATPSGACSALTATGTESTTDPTAR
jgi:hypothetical protein